MGNKATQRRLPDRAQTAQLYVALRPEYDHILAGIHQSLKELVDGANLAATFKFRVKGFDNFCEKIHRLKKSSAPIEINDLLGIRIICPFLEDLDTIETIIKQNYAVLEMEHKAEQHSFREFGYDSVHIMVKSPPLTGEKRLPFTGDVCEIQLRTILQEAWAEVEHELVYKSDIDMPNHTIRRKLASLNASLTLSDLIFQEIRDHQKEIRRRGLKRRQSVEAQTCICGTIQIEQIPDSKQPTDNEDLPIDDLSSKKLERLMLAALEAHSNNQLQEAIEIYSNLLRLKLDQPIRSLVYNHRGMALFALADYQKGLDDFSKAIEFNEDNVRAWTNRGLASRVLGRFEQSLENYNHAIEMAQQQYEGFWGRAQTYYEMQLFTKALDDCQKCLQRCADFKPAQELAKILHSQLF